MDNKLAHGHLVVVGKSKIIIPLRDMPYRVEVYFKKNPGPPPCVPIKKNRDRLEYKVIRSYTSHCRQMYTLVIKWKVHGIREIFWNAYYC